MHHLLSTYEVKTASSPDQISSTMLRATADCIAPQLTTLSHPKGGKDTHGQEQKTVNVIPVFKSGDRSLPKNYR